MVREAGATTSEIVADVLCAGLAESATLAVRLNAPLSVGVPEMIPVLAERSSPAGSLPPAMLQV